MTAAFPLAWPDGWPRTPLAARKDGRSTFAKVSDQGRRPLTFAVARDSLMAAIRKLGGTEVVVSSNFTLNSLGQPRGDRRRPDDEAVAVYFKRKGRPLVMARDAFQRAEENMRSLALALESLATFERHGGELLTERAFTGFAALPAPPKWFEVLEVEPTAGRDAVVQAYRRKARDLHPNRPGGSHDAMVRVNLAYQEAIAFLDGQR